jgi:hypothetical protein
LFRTFFIAFILALIAGILLDKIHTPIYLYIIIIAVLIVLAVFADNWLTNAFRKLIGQPSWIIDDIDYSDLIENRSIILKIKFRNNKGTKRIKFIDIAINYTSTFNETKEIAKEIVKENFIVEGNRELVVPVRVSIVAPVFVNDADEACSQGLPLHLSFSLGWLVNPVVCRITIPEDIHYTVSLTYDKSPKHIV